MASTQHTSLHTPAATPRDAWRAVLKGVARNTLEAEGGQVARSPRRPWLLRGPRGLRLPWRKN